MRSVILWVVCSLLSCRNIGPPNRVADGCYLIWSVARHIFVPVHRASRPGFRLGFKSRTASAKILVRGGEPGERPKRPRPMCGAFWFHEHSPAHRVTQELSSIGPLRADRRTPDLPPIYGVSVRSGEVQALPFFLPYNAFLCVHAQ